MQALYRSSFRDMFAPPSLRERRRRERALPESGVPPDSDHKISGAGWPWHPRLSLFGERFKYGPFLCWELFMLLSVRGGIPLNGRHPRAPGNLRDNIDREVACKKPALTLPRAESVTGWNGRRFRGRSTNRSRPAINVPCRTSWQGRKLRVRRCEGKPLCPAPP